MALLELNRDPTPKQVRQFALGWLPAFCGLLAAWGWYRGASTGWLLALAATGVASMLMGWFAPRAMRAVFIGWMWAAFPIGWTISHVLMGSIYFLVITPIGLVMRIVGHDPLARRIDPRADTYWTPRVPPADTSRYFRQF